MKGECSLDEFQFLKKFYESINNENIRNSIKNDLDYSIKRARSSKRLYLVCSITTSITAAVILVLNALSTPSIFKTLVAIMSALSMLSSSLIVTLQCYPNWIRYRKSAENMKREGKDFIAKISPYNEDDAKKNERILYTQCSNIAKHELGEYIKQNKDKKDAIIVDSSLQESNEKPID